MKKFNKMYVVPKRYPMSSMRLAGVRLPDFIDDQVYRAQGVIGFMPVFSNKATAKRFGRMDPVELEVSR